MVNSHSQPTPDQLLAVLAKSKDATAVYTSEDLHIGFVSDAMLTIWGKGRSVIGKTFEQAIPEIVGQPFTQLLQNVWRTGITHKATDTPATLLIDGVATTSYFDFEYRAIKNEAGETYCLLHTATDVTSSREAWQQVQIKENLQLAAHEELAATNEQLVQTEESLHERNQELIASKERLQTILDTVGEGIGITDPQGNIIYTNERARAILKIDQQSVLKRKNSSPEWSNRRLDGSLMPHEEHPITIAITTGKPVYNYLMLVQAEGEKQLYLNMNATVIKDEHGEVTGAIGIFTDVTERYLLQQQIETTLQQLSEQEERMRLAIASANLGTWYINSETREFIPSPRLKELFGYFPDETMPYEAAVDQIADDHKERVTQAVEAAITKSDAYDLEYPIIGYHDRQLRWVRATGRLYPATETTPANFSGTMADITERKQEDQRKLDFIGIVSHEMRSPLTSLNGYVQMLQLKAKKGNDNTIADISAKAKRQVDRMQALISGFLDVARVGEGKIKLEKKCFDMAELVKRAEEESLATVTSHQVVFHPVEHTPVEADQEKIEQVLINFINNAVKYSPQGSIINVSCTTHNDTVKVCVGDEGMGIAPQDILHVFERFYRVESEQMKTVKGFGIGLYICKEIIEWHGGRIGVNSEIGKGSEFWFEIPLDSK